MSDQAKLYAAIIGHKNTEFYLAYFRRAEERGYTPISWNWPGLFIGLFWLIYRRNYRWALIYFAVMPAIAICTSLLVGVIDEDSSRKLQLICIGLFQIAYFPLHANGIYYKWAQAELLKAKQLHPANLEQQIEYLSNRGGTNPNVMFMGLTILFMLFSFINSLQAPPG